MIQTLTMRTTQGALTSTIIPSLTRNRPRARGLWGEQLKSWPLRVMRGPSLPSSMLTCSTKLVSDNLPFLTSCYLQKLCWSTVFLVLLFFSQTQGLLSPLPRPRPPFLQTLLQLCPRGSSDIDEKWQRKKRKVMKTNKAPNFFLCTLPFSN